MSRKTPTGLNPLMPKQTQQSSLLKKTGKWGTIFGAIWITWEVKNNGQKDLSLLMPVLHAFALWNFIEQIDDTRWEAIQNLIVGIILIGEGLIMTYISS